MTAAATDHVILDGGRTIDFTTPGLPALLEAGAPRRGTWDDVAGLR